MKIEDKIAVLKLAGVVLRQSENDKLWEWYVPKENSPDGRSRLGRENYIWERSAWDSAWRYINGESWEEFDDEPWNTPKENNI